MPTCKAKISVTDDQGNVLRHSLLSWTEDMSCWSFSLPAYDSCPFAVTEDDDKKTSICGSCYAAINRYNMRNVLNAQYGRLLWCRQMLKHDYDMFISFMVNAINTHVQNNFFRVHDSGDFFSVTYVKAWIDIVKRLPHIKFWFPTRAWHNVTQKWKNALTELASLHNCTVRPSALYFNDPPPKVDWLSKGTTAITEGHKVSHKVCPKTVNGGNCETNHCRRCWFDRAQVAYLAHGILGRHKPFQPSNKMLAKRANVKQTYQSLTVKGQTI